MNVSSEKLDRPTALAILQSAQDSILQNRAIKEDHLDVEYASKDVLEKSPDVSFLEALVAAGVVKPRLEVQKSAWVEYHYAPITQNDVAVIYPGTLNEDIMMTLANKSITHVTGISQQGVDAVVEAEVGFEPTDLYKRIAPHVQALVAKCPASKQVVFPPPSDPSNMELAYFCGHWPRDGEFAAVEKVSFNFKKFDDGWKILIPEE